MKHHKPMPESEPQDRSSFYTKFVEWEKDDSRYVLRDLIDAHEAGERARSAKAEPHRPLLAAGGRDEVQQAALRQAQRAAATLGSPVPPAPPLDNGDDDGEDAGEDRDGIQLTFDELWKAVGAA